MPFDDSDYRQVAEVLGRKIAALREARGLTQEQLAERAGISRNQVQNIEHNRNNTRDGDSGRAGPGNPRLATVFNLAHALQVDVHYLIDPTRPAIELGEAERIE